MRSILLLISANLSRRRTSAFLTGLSICLVTILLASASGILIGFQQPFDDIFDKANASHLLLQMDVRNNNIKAIRQWAAQQPQVARVSEPSPYWMCGGPLVHKGNKIDLMVQLTEYTSDHRHQDKLRILTGKASLQPALDEIWLPHYLSVRYGIVVGDSLQIPSAGGPYWLTVSATVADPHYGSGMVNPTRAWIAPGALPFFVPVQQAQNVSVGIRLKDSHQLQAFLGRFGDTFEFSGTLLPFDIFRSAYLSIYQIIGAVLLVFALLALGIALFLMRASIGRAIQDEYQLTGVYKTLGFTPWNLRWVYVWQYTGIALLALPVGLFISFFCLELLLDSLTQTMGSFVYAMPYGQIAAIAAILIVSGTVVCSILASGKAARVKPIQALRNQTGPDIASTQHISVSLTRHWKLPVPALLGRHFLFAEPGRSFVSLAMATVTVFVFVFSVNIAASFTGLKYNKAAWGFDAGNIHLHRKSAVLIELRHHQLLSIFRQNPAIRHVLPYSFLNLAILPANGAPEQEVFGKVYEGDMSAGGLTNLKGTHPQQAREIALCIGTAQRHHKNIGDSLALFIDGQKTKFVVTGIYQDVSNLGQGFRLPAIAYKQFNPLFEPDFYGLVLQDSRQTDATKQALLQQLGETIALETSMEDRIQQLGIVGNMQIALLCLSVFFTLVLALALWNDVQLSVWAYRKPFGIMKTFGCTPGQVRQILLWKTGGILLLSLLAGIPLGIGLSPVLMSAVTKQIGLVAFPFVMDLPGTAFIVPLVVLLGIVISWMASSSVHRISSRLLLTD